MAGQEVARKPDGRLPLDLCFACHAIWFDQHESAQLTPGAVIQLFREIHEHASPPAPLNERLRCPRCREGLALTHDVQRTNRISYYRCLSGHGRLTTFFQFLREKNFVRSLTAAEITQLRANVRQVRCSSCGAPVNVEKDAECGYCRAPISILDADAVKRTLAELVAAERQPAPRADPAVAVATVLAGNRYEPAPAPRFQHRMNTPRAAAAMPTLVGGGGLLDLVGDALDFLMDD